MAVAPGTTLGPYEIIALLGAGGMGEVYRARDTRLDRTVAIKILPAHLSGDDEARRRFEREARAVSSLSHPNICALYDVGRHGDSSYLVMEYLEGETLAERLRKGPLPTEDLLRYAAEIAGALNNAHGQGLVHRDLKPGNIMLTAAGAKVLDFGLARSVGSRSHPELTRSPTMSEPLTAEGTIVGTIQYMSPEQLEGAAPDARSDIFAFGAVLYEMATGRAAFEGKSQASVIAAIMEKDPVPVTTAQPMAPPALDRLVKTCLAKDPDERRQTMHDVLLDLKWMSEGGSRVGIPALVASRRRVRERLAWSAVALFALVSLALGIAYYRNISRDARVIRAYIPAPERTRLYLLSSHPGPASISPDGKRIVFAAMETDARKQVLWVRELDASLAHPLAGTEGAAYPFWSPDGQTVGFFADGKLKKVAASGGPTFTLCEAANGKGGTWSADGSILFAPTHNSGICLVSSAGGDARPVTSLDTLRQERSHRFPQFLPDGRRFLFLAWTAGAQASDAIMIGSLDGDQSRILMKGRSNATYEAGHVLFVRDGTLMAQRFDARRCRITGEVFPVVEGVAFITGASFGVFSASQSDILMYQLAGAEQASELVWTSRTGEPIDHLGDRADYYSPRLSPDGEHIAVEIADPRTSARDIWIYETSSGMPTRFTFDAADDKGIVWSPDGTRIIFSSARKGHYDLYMKSLVGNEPEVLLLESEDDKRATSWSSDERFVAYASEGDVWVLPLFGDRQPFLFLGSEFDEGDAAFAPDSRWIAYECDESGKYEVYVTAFPEPGRKWQVSRSGGFMPGTGWRQDGRELLYVDLDGTLTVVDVRSDEGSFRSGPPTPLFDVTGANGGTATADFERFLLALQVAGTASDMLALVINWTAEFPKN